LSHQTASLLSTSQESDPIVVDDNDINDPSDLQNQAQTHTTNSTANVILPPLIKFVKGVVEFLQLRTSFIEEIGIDGFTCKSTSYHLKIQTIATLITIESYFLKEINAQYHNYQLQADKSLRIIIRNLHPSTPTTEIASAIEEIGHSVRNVTNVIVSYMPKPKHHSLCSLSTSIQKIVQTAIFFQSLHYSTQK